MAKKKTSEEFKQIFDEAMNAALKASEDYRKKFGEPMYCGFAWVVIDPGNHPFANWVKKNNHGQKGYPKGVHIWGPGAGMTQSMDIKEHACAAFTNVLVKHGIPAYWSSRAD